MASQFAPALQNSSDAGSSGVTFMEDALLLHVSECPHCLQTALGRRERLRDHGCNDFRRLAEHVSAGNDRPERKASVDEHLDEELMDEYLFGRLGASAKRTLERHLVTCRDCRSALDTHREFLACMRTALKGYAADREVSSPSVRFTPEAIAAAKKSLAASRLTALEALRLMEREDVSIPEIERSISRDPVLSGHLIKVANSALMSYGQEVRSVGNAVSRIGLARTRLHVWGHAAKRMFTSPQLQKVWNHSVAAAQVSRQLAGLTQVIPADEASLIGLVHDVGQLVLLNLGPSYERAYTQRIAKDNLGLQIERELCGTTHPEVGADLLESWQFPRDMVEAVRYHHDPARADSAMASLLYVAEHWLPGNEDLCNVTLHGACLRRLGLSHRDLDGLGLKHSPDLEMLRFAAA